MSIFISRRRTVLISFILIICIFFFSRNSSSNTQLSKEIIDELTHFKDTTLHDLTSSLESHSGADGDDEVLMVKPAEEILEPCTIINPLTNQFYDLRPLSSIGKDGVIQTWNSKGFDYGKNFSIGVCSTPLKNLKALTELDFVDSSNKSNIGGYYTNNEGNKISIGSISTELKFRGLNMVLEYTDGDKCESSPNLMKSTLLTFKCDREMMSKARVNYLGSFDDCSYFFEVKTIHACATSNEKTENAIWGIFIIILMSALGVYFFAGIMYKIIKRHYEHSIRKNGLIV